MIGTFLYLRASTEPSLINRPCRVERRAHFGLDGVPIEVYDVTLRPSCHFQYVMWRFNKALGSTSTWGTFVGLGVVGWSQGTSYSKPLGLRVNLWGTLRPERVCRGSEGSIVRLRNQHGMADEVHEEARSCISCLLTSKDQLIR